MSDETAESKTGSRRMIQDCLADLPQISQALKHAVRTLEDCAEANNGGVADLHRRAYEQLVPLVREQEEKGSL